MVRLCRAIRTIGQIVLIVIHSLDLEWSLHVGDTPRFAVSELTHWRPIFEGASEHSRDLASGLLCSDSGESLIHHQLRIVMSDMRHLAGLLNSALEHDQPLAGSDFAKWLDVIQHRLLRLSYDDSGLTELIRLGMLACLTLLHRFPGRRMSLTYLTERLRHALTSTDQSALDPSLKLWLLMMGAMAVLDLDDRWLRTTWDELRFGSLTWEQVRAKLGAFLWIDCVHDDPGRRAFMAIARLGQSPGPA
jgi:hypothetical protein